MKIPRDIDGIVLANKLKKLGYKITRQTGSHLRLSSENGEHHVTIPMHSPLKVGTFAAILNDVSSHLNMTKEELIRRLF
jgi:predicted RNA binding protein YcfA (HicA-like mRNA interferase family)